jgi:uncharacterized protein YjbI with pentapeptide repeats
VAEGQIEQAQDGEEANGRGRKLNPGRPDPLTAGQRRGLMTATEALVAGVAAALTISVALPAIVTSVSDSRLRGVGFAVLLGALALAPAWWTLVVFAHSRRPAAGSPMREGTDPDLERYARRPDGHGLLLPGVDMREADLAGVRLDAANFAGARLDRAILVGAMLRCASLVDARLDAARLADAQLSQADLRRARLDRADACRAVFAEACLDGARLVGARLDQADFTQARLRGARLARAELRNASMAGADLRDASLELADLRGADLSTARLEGARLDGAIADETTRLPPGFQLKGQGG